ncbi:MAG: hypothetical protein IV093_04785 [Rubrivivax sp.]|nr:hypothetical protein [Rubrivivax sp.]
MGAAYLLSGPPGGKLQLAVGMLAFGGFQIEPVTFGHAYRVLETEALLLKPDLFFDRTTIAAFAYRIAADKEPAWVAEMQAKVRKVAQGMKERDANMANLARLDPAWAEKIQKAQPKAGDLFERARATIPEGISYGPMPIAGGAVFRSNIKRERPYRRSEISGRVGLHYLASAIDLGLTVTICDPETLRYEVTGPTALQVRLLAQMQGKSEADAMAALGITAGTVAEEDRPDVPEIKVTLPTRVTKSSISHDGQGRISEVTQTETSED